MTPPHLTSARLMLPGVRHGFFGRIGGVSTGAYASLNTGPGSGDDATAVAENRARCARALGIAPSHLVTLHQMHTPTVIVVREPLERPGPQADAMVTTAPGIALGVLAADCMPYLFCDPEARIIGAAHAGWRGALAGVLEATVAAMTKLGADPSRIVAALGPCLRQPNFEVGMELVREFTNKHVEAKRFFAAGAASDKRQFDLAGFGRWRLSESGVGAPDDLDICTRGEAESYFSYRGSRRAGNADYGRNLSAIALV